MTKAPTYKYGQVREDGKVFVGWNKQRNGVKYPIWRTPEAIEKSRERARDWARRKYAEKKAAKAKAESEAQYEIEFVSTPSPTNTAPSWDDVLKELDDALRPKRRRDTKAELRELYNQLSLYRRIVAAFKMIFKIV